MEESNSNKLVAPFQGCLFTFVFYSVSTISNADWNAKIFARFLYIMHVSFSYDASTLWPFLFAFYTKKVEKTIQVNSIQHRGAVNSINKQELILFQSYSLNKNLLSHYSRFRCCIIRGLLLQDKKKRNSHSWKG